MKFVESLRMALLARMGASAQLLRDLGMAPQPQWAGQHTNPRRNAERRLKRAIGARQFTKQRKAWQRTQVTRPTQPQE